MHIRWFSFPQVVQKQTLGEVVIWPVIWWPVVPEIFVPKIIKISKPVFKWQSIIFAMYFWDTMYMPDALVNSAFHPSGVCKSRPVCLRSSQGAFTCVRWQLTLRDPIWQETLYNSVIDFLLKVIHHLCLHLHWHSLPIMTYIKCHQTCHNTSIFTMHITFGSTHTAELHKSRFTSINQVISISTLNKINQTWSMLPSETYND